MHMVIDPKKSHCLRKLFFFFFSKINTSTNNSKHKTVIKIRNYFYLYWMSKHLKKKIQKTLCKKHDQISIFKINKK
jgi:hypothetical protein